MTLVLAATPLGDSRDASPRLTTALAEADVLAAEDTRRLRSLATTLGVTPSGRIVSYYEDVEQARLPGLLAAVREGRTVVLVTDAGMPSVSDPGYRLVRACVAEDLPVTCLPGPSAVTTALAVSGLATDRFCFDGFVPRRAGERARWLRDLADEQRTVVFFESPHRLAATLSEAADALGADRRAVVCRDLTKVSEEIVRGGLTEVADWASGGVRGEATVVVEGAQRGRVDISTLVGEVEARVAAGERLKTVTTEIADATGVSKKQLYDEALRHRGAGGVP